MKNKKTQIIFFGTPEFSVPALKALISADFCEAAKVVTRPDKPIGRHHSKLVPSPVKKLAQEYGLPISAEILQLRPAGSAQDDGLIKHNADLGVVVAYGKILPKKLIDSFPLGILNIHPSFLPEYRGSSPIQSAILNQDKQTGVTIMKLDNKPDHGPIVAQEKIDLDQTETSGELHDKLAHIGAGLLIKILPDYIAGRITPKPQDDSKASYTKKLTKQDGKIDFKKTTNNRLISYEPLVRAMNPWPGAWTLWNNKKLIIWSTKKDGTPTEVQLEGKKRMPYEQFLKGHSAG